MGQHGKLTFRRIPDNLESSFISTKTELIVEFILFSFVDNLHSQSCGIPGQDNSFRKFFWFCKSDSKIPPSAINVWKVFYLNISSWSWFWHHKPPETDDWWEIKLVIFQPVRRGFILFVFFDPFIQAGTRPSGRWYPMAMGK